MDEPTRRLRALARRILDVYAARIPTRAALLSGSAGRGDADFYSDLDLILYADELPGEEERVAAREALGGTELRPIFAEADAFAEQYRIDGIACQVGYATVAAMDELLDGLLVRLEKIDTPLQKVASGLLEGIVLADDGLLERWRARVRAYPEPLRRAMVERHWRVFPLWWYEDVIASRDGELWRLEQLLEAGFDLLAVLAGVNRIYYSRFELKRLRALVGRMQLAPPNLADRLEALFRLPADEAAAALGRLVLEVQAIVRAELPDADVPLPRPPGTRLQPWR